MTDQPTRERTQHDMTASGRPEEDEVVTAGADRQTLLDIARAVFESGHIPPGTDPAQVIMPTNNAIVDRVLALATTLASTGAALRVPAEDMERDIGSIPREAHRLHHVATARRVGAEPGPAAAEPGPDPRMLIRLALHYLPDGNRPPNGTNDAAVWDYRVSAARELLKQMGANGA